LLAKTSSWAALSLNLIEVVMMIPMLGCLFFQLVWSLGEAEEVVAM
jgi:hypothetical protein